MSLQTSIVPKLDPNLFTGSARLVSGIARMGSVTLDTPYGEFARWIYAGVTGDVSIVKWDGTNQTLVGLAAGVWHPIYSIAINTAGTTALSLVWGS